MCLYVNPYFHQRKSTKLLLGAAAVILLLDIGDNVLFYAKNRLKQSTDKTSHLL